MFKDCIVEPITPPTFAVSCQTSGIWVVVNEYELRQLMVAVAKGEWPGYRFLVEDHESPQRAVIKDDGSLSKPLPGLSVAGDYTLELIRIKREKEAAEKEK